MRIHHTASQLAIALALFLSQANGQTPAVDNALLFGQTTAIDISAKHDFPQAQNLNDDAANQLKGMCSVAEFRDFPETDRHVYSFDPWPGTSDDLGAKAFCFNFELGTDGVTSEKIAYLGGGGNLIRGKDATTAQPVLRGFGNLDWSGIFTHRFRFNKPVLAFSTVLRSSGEMDLNNFYWPNAEQNGYPVSYTLADGTVVPLGKRGESGAHIKANSNAFIGVIDRSGRGIVSVDYTVRGLAGNTGQSMDFCDFAFVTMPKPAVAAIVNLKSSCDFPSPSTIAPTPTNAAPGLATLDAFRFIVGDHRFVYSFDTWPSENRIFSGNSGDFPFDLKGDGSAGEKMTVTATSAANDAKPSQIVLRDDAGSTCHALGGLGNIHKGASAEQKFTFAKPVWAVGVTYHSSADLTLESSAGGAKEYPVSYTLSDGTTVNLGAPGASGGTIAANSKTFVGVIDDSDKGIASITFSVQGTAEDSQSLSIDDVAFAIAGPPPGDWKLTMSDDFSGNQLDPAHWSTGYKFVDVINDELQGFVPENVVVGNGVCTIKTEKRDCRNTDRFGKEGKEQQFASGAFTSVDKFTQTYGYFEARIKMPKARGAGVWPAFWMLPDRGKAAGEAARYNYMDVKNGNGRGMEIDIFEFMPRWKTLQGLFPIHMGCIWSYGPATADDPAPHGYGNFAEDHDGWGPGELDFPNLDGQFHTYGLYWSPQRLIWYVDNKPVFRVKDAQHVPNVPHYFLFNVSVQGNGWGKSPDKSNPSLQDIADDLPNRMQIDYFRAYSGTLREAVPADAGDIAGAANADATSSKTAPAAQAPAVAAPVNSTPQAPAAPVNSHIASPSSG